jgi:hypothetical protein
MSTRPAAGIRVQSASEIPIWYSVSAMSPSAIVSITLPSTEIGA